MFLRELTKEEIKAVREVEDAFDKLPLITTNVNRLELDFVHTEHEYFGLKCNAAVMTKFKKRDVFTKSTLWTDRWLVNESWCHWVNDINTARWVFRLYVPRALPQDDAQFTRDLAMLRLACAVS